jgi:hypothetical protein
MFDIIQMFTECIDTSVKLCAGDTLPEDMEYAIKLSKETLKDGTPSWKCSYYMVDHTNRTLFWMTEFNGDDMIKEVYGVDDVKHLCECYNTVCFIYMPYPFL